MSEQTDLFGASRAAAAPEGLVYRPGLIDARREAELLAHVRGLPFAEFRFHGYVGKRRVVSFGWSYDFEREAVARAPELPPFLLGPARGRRRVSRTCRPLRSSRRS
jgi:hypothetical protein